MEKLLAAMKKEQNKEAVNKPSVPTPAPVPEKKVKGAGVEIFADDFEDDEV